MIAVGAWGAPTGESVEKSTGVTTGRYKYKSRATRALRYFWRLQFVVLLGVPAIPSLWAR
jgi:hypothetical protein